MTFLFTDKCILANINTFHQTLESDSFEVLEIIFKIN